MFKINDGPLWIIPIVILFLLIRSWVVPNPNSGFLVTFLTKNFLPALITLMIFGGLFKGRYNESPEV